MSHVPRRCKHVPRRRADSTQRHAQTMCTPGADLEMTLFARILPFLAWNKRDHQTNMSRPVFNCMRQFFCILNTHASADRELDRYKHCLPSVGELCRSSIQTKHVHISSHRQNLLIKLIRHTSRSPLPKKTPSHLFGAASACVGFQMTYQRQVRLFPEEKICDLS